MLPWRPSLANGSLLGGRRRGRPENVFECRSALFEAHKADLGYGLLLKRHAPDVGQATPAQMLGYPIASSSSVTSTTTSGNTLAVLGDFSRYLVYDRIGTFLEFQPIVVDGSGLPTGQRAIVGHKRVGADCLDVNAFRHLKA